MRCTRTEWRQSRSDRFRIGGYPLSLLEVQLKRLAMISREINIILIPDAALTVQQVVHFLDICRRAGFENLHVVEQAPTVTTK